jgi:hypothetical protein
MRERKYVRKTGLIECMSLSELIREASRSKRHMLRALEQGWGPAYLLRKELCHVYGRELSKRLSTRK